jgi:hypothetical protein
MADLPQPLPTFEAAPADLAAWASKALPEPVTATWRPGHSEHAPLLVRFQSGRELFFETVAEACRPERFGAAVIAVTGKPMTAYSKPQLQVLVAALVRMASLTSELDERDFWGDTGATFLRACLTASNIRTIALDPDQEAGRLARYRAAARYDAELGRQSDELVPHVLVAVDREALLIPRGPFLAFANRRRRATSPGTVNAQMQRLGWESLDLRPRKPGEPKSYPRPHLRLWQIANGWDGLHVVIEDGKVVDIDADRGPGSPGGPAEHARATPAYSVEAGPGGDPGPLFDDQETAP